MSLLAEVAAFSLGAYLSIRLLAALYALLDLFYTIRTVWPRVARGVLGWGAITLGSAWLLRRPLRAALLGGLVAYLLFYLSLFPLRDLLLGKLRRRPLP